MARLDMLARKYDLIVIEDAAHTLGAFRPDATGGTVRVGDLAQSACLSFYPNKGITTGEGGMVVTDDVDRAERMRVLRLHGLDSQAWRRYAQGGSWYTEILEAGFKYNLTDMAAALGLHQLKRADWLLARRRRIAGRYLELLGGLAGLSLPNGPEALNAMGGQGVLKGHSWFLYPVQLTPAAPVSRDTFIKALAGRGISCAVHWMPLHLHPFYRQMGYAPGDFPGAEAGFAGLVSLPFFVDLSDEQISYVAENIKEILDSRA
jgi:dTDP-4-amino-4,6-dideoxygalactose transaminase